MAYTPAAIKIYLIGKGLNPSDAEKFSNLPWVSSIANGEIKLPPGLPELSGESVAAYKKQAKDAGVPLEEFAQQKLAPSTVQTAAARPPVQAGVAAAAQAAADIPQPIAPMPQMAGGAPSPLGPLLVGTSTMAAPPEMLPSSSALPFGMEQPQPIAPPNDMPGTMAGFAPVTSQGMTNEKAAAIAREAARVGIPASDLATVMQYETMGKMDPSIKGGTGGNYTGLIQFGPSERKQYGVNANSSFDEQATAAGQFLIDRGLPKWLAAHPDATEQEKRTALYSTVNAGSPGKENWNKSDGNNTVKGHTQEMFADGSPWMQKADTFMGEAGADPFANVELQDAGVASSAWPNAPASAPTLAAPAPPTGDWAPPTQGGGTAADFGDPSQPSLSTDWTPPAFAQGDFGPPTPAAPVLGGGVGYDTLPPSADPNMMQRPLEPPLGPLVPPVSGAPVLGGMGGALASNEDALGPLLDPSMPLPMRNPGAPAPLPDPSMPLPIRAPAPPLPPPVMTFDPRATPTMTPPPQISSLAASPPSLPPDIAQPPLPPPVADLSMPLPLRNPGAPPSPMGVEQSPPTMFDGSLPGTNAIDDMGYPPSVPNFSGGFDPQSMVGGAPSPFSTGGPPGTTPSSTDPHTYLPQTQSSINQPPMSPFDPATAPPLGAPTMPPNAPGLNVSGTTGFPQPSFGASGWPNTPLPPTGPNVASAPNMLSPGLPTPSQSFSPTAGPTLGSPTNPLSGVPSEVAPSMPSWAIPGAFGMPQAGPGNIGGYSPGQYAGGTSVPTSMASSTGPYMGIGPNPATTLGQTDFGAGSPGALGMVGPGPQPGMTDWSKSGRLTGGVGGGPISEGASPAPAGNAASSASMESHALQLMAAQHVADVANAYQNLAPRMVGAPVRSTISGSSMLGLTGRPSIMQSDLIRPYGMNVGFSPSFGSRF